jgi:hypothetical protein
MNPWLILGFVLAAAAAGGAGLYQGREIGMAEVQHKWDKERAQQEAEYAAAQAAAREKEQSLQANADQLRQEKDREIRNLNARASALSNSLRERPSRTTTESSTVSSTANVGASASGCNGSGLSREDAEFLVGEAARAEQLKAALRQCQAQYQTLRSQ